VPLLDGVWGIVVECLRRKVQGRIFRPKTDDILGGLKARKVKQFEVFPKFCLSDLSREKWDVQERVMMR